MNRRDLFRQTLLGATCAAAAGAASAREFPPGYDASRDLDRADWKPLFLDDHQNETLVAFSDMLIPTTDTPGAKAALVNRFLDQLLAAEAYETRQRFVESLAFLDGESFARYRTAFTGLTHEQQTEVMTFMAYPHTSDDAGEDAPNNYAGYGHFSNLKGWISQAYYSSEIGMRSLGYTGAPGGVFEGCR